MGRIDIIIIIIHVGAKEAKVKKRAYQRIELAIESHRANNKQMVENDFSPPDNDFGSLSRATPALAEF